MTDPDAEATPADLPDSLLERVDSLGRAELEALRSYVVRSIESLPTGIAEQIEEEATGEVVDVEEHGEYALVRIHPPDPDGAGVDADVVSLYHVQREQSIDGSETLHWSYLGDGHETEQIRCANCGRTFGDDHSVCPHCHSTGTDQRGSEDES